MKMAMATSGQERHPDFGDGGPVHRRVTCQTHFQMGYRWRQAIMVPASPSCLIAA